MNKNNDLRIGIDMGGTKIEGIVLGEDGAELARIRVETPTEDYPATVRAIRDLVLDLERKAGQSGTVGIGIPGAVSPATGKVKNANSTWLIGRYFDRDLSQALERPIRMANDANCFAVSETTDGAATGASVVFGTIIGTGCGAGIVVNGALLTGAHAIGGEWGHNPLPWPDSEELLGRKCYCGKRGCIETWISGPGLAAEYASQTGQPLQAEFIIRRARKGQKTEQKIMDAYYDRMARAFASVINILDPDVIVVGGGLSNIDEIYSEIPRRLPAYVFSDHVETPIVKNKHGASSGVRGAAWLWPRKSEA